MLRNYADRRKDNEFVRRIVRVGRVVITRRLASRNQRTIVPYRTIEAERHRARNELTMCYCGSATVSTG